MEPQKPGTPNESSSSSQSSMQIVSGSAPQGPNPSSRRRPSRLARARSAVVEAQTSGSLNEVIEETREEVPSLTDFESYNLHTKYNLQSEIDEIVNIFQIPDNLTCYLPTKAARACNATADLVVFTAALEAGLRFPLHPFIPDLLRSYRIHPGQLHPNGWRMIICFMVRCIQLNTDPSVRIFRRMFHIKNHSKQHNGWVIVNHRNMGKGKHICNTKSFPDSITGWKDRFFYIRKAQGSWSDTFQPEWGSADDSSLSNWVLSPEEDEIRQALEADGGQTHSTFLLHEQTLVDCGLSPLQGEALSAAKKIWERRVHFASHPPKPKKPRTSKSSSSSPASASGAPPIDIPPSRKRGLADEREEIPAFHSSEETSSFDQPFVPAWGVRTSDSVFGDGNISADWFQSSPTPFDQSQLMAISDDSIFTKGLQSASMVSH